MIPTSLQARLAQGTAIRALQAARAAASVRNVAGLKGPASSCESAAGAGALCTAERNASISTGLPIKSNAGPINRGQRSELLRF